MVFHPWESQLLGSFFWDPPNPPLIHQISIHQSIRFQSEISGSSRSSLVLASDAGRDGLSGGRGVFLGDTREGGSWGGFF